MNNAINLLYVAVAMVVLMAVSFYFLEIQRYDERYDLYEGALIEGVPHLMFTSCSLLEVDGRNAEDYFFTDMIFKDLDAIDEKFKKYYKSHSEPVYIKVYAEIIKKPSSETLFDVNVVSHTLVVERIIDVQPYSGRKCEPLFIPNPFVCELPFKNDVLHRPILSGATPTQSSFE